MTFLILLCCFLKFTRTLHTLVLLKVCYLKILLALLSLYVILVSGPAKVPDNSHNMTTAANDPVSY